MPLEASFEQVSMNELIPNGPQAKEAKQHRGGFSDRNTEISKCSQQDLNLDPWWYTKQTCGSRCLLEA